MSALSLTAEIALQPKFETVRDCFLNAVPYTVSPAGLAEPAGPGAV